MRNQTNYRATCANNMQEGCWYHNLQKDGKYLPEDEECQVMCCGGQCGEYRKREKKIEEERSVIQSEQIKRM